MLKFNPYDFGLEELGNTNQLVNIEDAAKVANVKLKKWLDKSPSVSGRLSPQWGYYGFEEAVGIDITHVAKLVCIEELKGDKE